MSYKPGSRGWRDAQVAAEAEQPRHGGQDSPRGEPPIGAARSWVALVSRNRREFAIAGAILLLILFLLSRRSSGHHTAPPAAPAKHPPSTVSVVTRTAWTDAEARPFTSGTWGVAVDASLLPRTGPAQLWPALPSAQVPPAHRRLVVLGEAGNSQESDRWAAVRMVGGEVGWLPVAALAMSGTLRTPPEGRPDSYVIVGPRALTAWERPALPSGAPAVVPAARAMGTVGAGSVLPLRGVLPRYFDGRRGTSWVRVHLKDGRFGWLYQEGDALHRDLRYLLPPPRAAQSPWTAPLPGGQTMLGAYGEALGTAQWALRGATLVRGNAGDPVVAAADGVVIFVGYSVRWGRSYIVVRHNGVWEGWQTAYLGLASPPPRTLHIAEGQAVHRGQMIGYLAQGLNQQPTSLLFAVQTPDGTPIESQNILQWP